MFYYQKKHGYGNWTCEYNQGMGKLTRPALSGGFVCKKVPGSIDCVGYKDLSECQAAAKKLNGGFETKITGLTSKVLKVFN